MPPALARTAILLHLAHRSVLPFSIPAAPRLSCRQASHINTHCPTLLSAASMTDQPSSPPPSPGAKRTFYRRQLPTDTCISFSSPEGRAVFATAMANGGTYSFFPLIEQLQTQPEPAYCGLTTLVIVLNALAVDPRRSWKGPWRWYEEGMLNCCVDLEQVKSTGITFSTFACLAKCQGLEVEAVHGTNSTVEEFRRVVKETCTAPASIETPPTSFLIVSYTRQVIGQTGTGHFSPVGAYDEESDHVLVLDTARFKYGPHWVPLELMFEALLPFDPDTNKSRGYMTLSYDGVDGGNAEQLSHLPLSLLFGSKKSKDFIRRQYKQYLESDSDGGESVTLASVVSFWTQNNTNSSHVCELVEPQILPVETADVKMVQSVRELIQSLIRANDENASAIPQGMFSTSRDAGTFPGECCNSSTNNASGRVLEISPAEVLFVVYLASLSKEARRDIVYDSAAADVDDTAREQLLAEASLISFAIETCDADI
ncbi:hypothetical protein ACHAXT_001640 [Thalassiosira profunda]